MQDARNTMFGKKYLIHIHFFILTQYLGNRKIKTVIETRAFQPFERLFYVPLKILFLIFKISLKNFPKEHFFSMKFG